MAQYADMHYYKAVVEAFPKNGSVLITYTDYQEQEEVDLGRVEIPLAALEAFREKANSEGKKERSKSWERDRDRDKDRDRRSDRDRDRKRSRRSRSRSRDKKKKRSRSRSRNRGRNKGKKRSRSPRKKVLTDVYSDDEEVNLDMEILKREQMGATVSAGRGYARRPVGYKQSLNHTSAPTKFAGTQEPRRHYARSKAVQREASPSPERGKMAVPSQEALARLHKLRVRYFALLQLFSRDHAIILFLLSCFLQATYGDASSGKAAANKAKGGDFETA